MPLLMLKNCNKCFVKVNSQKLHEALQTDSTTQQVIKTLAVRWASRHANKSVPNALFRPNNFAPPGLSDKSIAVISNISETVDHVRLLTAFFSQA